MIRSSRIFMGAMPSGWVSHEKSKSISMEITATGLAICLY